MKGFLFSTRRQDPQDAQVDSHRLMVRAGLIDKLGAGLYHILPMGLRSLRKIEDIVRQEMNRTGAYEFELPILVPATLWQKSGRYDIMGKELFRIKDRHDNWNVLGPTHEETFTDLMSGLLKSYKDLPVNVYQIHTKFRDEIRPRFGVIRSREFIMKDAYSFHNDQDSLNQTYQDMRLAYRRIFARAGLETIPVEADTGSMGGSGSEEFMVPSQIGEETLLLNESRSYRSNQEKTPVIYPELNFNIEKFSKIKQKDIENQLTKINTPNTKTIESLADFLKLNTNQLLKTILYRAEYSENKTETVMILVRGDRQLHEIKLKNHLGAIEVAPAPNSDFDVIGSVAGFAGPLNLKKQVRILFDTSVATGEKWVTGANQVDYHYQNFYPVLVDENWYQKLVDVSLAVDGDISPNGEGVLSSVKGIEVGHIFKLGDKYTKAMSMTVLNQNQKPIYPLMGCYGIGLNRTLATVIEQNFDDKGIIWPISVAPFEIVLVDICKTDDDRKKVEKLYQQLIDVNFDLLWDNRDLRPGVKFNDAELIGFPIRLTAGKTFFENGKIEVVVRKSGEKNEVDVSQLIDELNRIRNQLIQEMPEVPISS
ncbi:MAG: proline--tRNA ligase [Leptonema sp. (in: Bacteria)]|nr:proline--tRNA ligase [Leptonema sp. (in: bacteria)]